MKSDRFAETIAATGQFLSRHRRLLIVGLVVVAAAVLVLLWNAHGKASARERSHSRLADAEKAAFEALAAQSEDKAALDRALEELRKIHEESPDSPVGIRALYRYAEMLYAAKRYEEAAAAYQRLLAKVQPPSPMSGIAQFVEPSLAAALEQSGKWGEAAKIHQSIAARVTGEAAAQHLWNQARCLQRLGKNDEASALLRKVVELAPASYWAELAKYELRPSDHAQGRPEVLPPAAAGEDSARPVEGRRPTTDDKQ